MLCHIPRIKDEKLIVGLETSDDAAVYQIDEERALVQTLDFFTPVVDDPYTYGQIAAANSLSDVYAMGGQPLTAMNIVCFPSCLSPDVLKEILKGGADKIMEANCLLVGGHTVEDNEPKYGLSVTGMVSPHEIWTNAGAKVGEYLILTKPIGTGVLNTAIKVDMVDESQYEDAVKVMVTLNKYGMEALKDFNISACTDITGFGLLGHAYEMAKGSHVSLEIYSDQVPFIAGVKEFARMGIIPGGMYANKKHIEKDVNVNGDVEEVIMDLLYDPQTSGGLLVSIAEEQVEEAIEKLTELNLTEFAVIGKVVEKDEFTIYIK
ncbi:selenide, water dikinase [Alkaliphilus metalliredigens QYMF]|uniref:Selenide, water dikinase n=1 Tax=Alkaliphilus metalliredigens (strain QYMF) TaxID=293826 RepID=A6TQL0_ALKMQ|nr:selenide, water dikinase [Alkaliphilus metalliredigens QYMF]